MNIYVSYLPETMNEENLKLAFTKYGKVSSAKIIRDRETNRSRGFAFVEMRDNYEAQLALDGLRVWEVDGKKIQVTVAREREERNNRFARNW